MRVLIFIACCISGSLIARCQPFHKTFWHFGSTNVGLYFDTAGNPPTVTTDSYTPYTNEGCSVYNDPNTGDLKFYTDGIVVVDANGNLMPNGSGLQGNISCFGSGKIGVDPSNCNRIYIFHNGADMSFNTLGNVKYTVVDLTLAGNGTDLNPLGDVVSGEKNIQIMSGAAEAMELVPQTGTRNYWLILTKNTSQTIEVYHFTQFGLAFQNSFSLPGELTDMRAFKFSPNYDKAIISSLREDESTVIFEFDAVTGTISNQQLMPGTPLGNNNGWYGIFDVEWSSDGTKAYLSKYRDSSPAAGGKLYQYDFNTPTDPPSLIYQISNSATNLGRGLRRGPDDKIYWIYHNPITNSVQHIAAVNDPNQPDLNCNFEPISIDAGANLGGVHLFPTFIEFRNQPPIADVVNISHTATCNNLNEPITIAIADILNDPDGDLTTLNLATSDVGAISIEDQSILLELPDGFEGLVNIHIEFCDNYCYPLCGQHDFTIEVTFDPEISADPLPEELFQCGSDPLIIDSGLADYDILWNTGETTNSISVSESGQYSLSATNSYGCTINDTLQIEFFQYPDLLEQEEIFLCGESEITLLTPVDDAELEWSTGQTTSSIVVTTTGPYELTATWDNGCSTSDDVYVEFQTNGESIDLLQSNLTVCASDEYLLEVTLTSFEFEWNTGDITSTLLVNEPGVYSVMASNDFGCAIADTITIEFFDVPEILEIENVTTCLTEVTLETAITDANLLWSTSETSNTIEVTTSDDYMLEVTYPNGCVVHDTVVVQFEDFEISLGEDQSICEGQTISLSLETISFADILWNTSETTTTILVSESGLYSVTATTDEGCSASDDVNVDVLNFPVVALGNDTSLCEPATLSLTLPAVPGFQYQWNTGESGSSIESTETGTYIVTVSNGPCIATDSIEVYINPIPSNPFSQSIPYCFELASEPLVLDAGTEGTQFAWSTGENTQIVSISNYGIVEVDITTDENCSMNYSVQIEMECPGSIFIPNSFTPDGDGINDSWFVSGYNFENFHVRIFNRWGELFWESTNENIPWLGQRLSDGEFYVQDNVYTYIVTCTFHQSDDSLSEIQEFRGHITIIR